MIVPQIIGIMAVAENGVIGTKGRLPWHYPEDLDFFEKTTKNQVIVMGRKTCDSLPDHLFRDRQAIVFSRNFKYSHFGAITVHSTEEFFKNIHQMDSSLKIFMIGGAQIANLFLKNHWVSSFFLTIIHHNYSGDTSLQMSLFNSWNKKEIKRTQNFTLYLMTPSEKHP